MSAGAAAAAAAAAARRQAIKASGVVVSVRPEEFLGLVQRQQAPLVVYAAVSRWFSGPSHQYLTSYKGLAFYAESPTPLTLPSGCEIVEAASIWVPG